MTTPARDAQADAEIAAAFKAVGIDDTAIERRERLRVVPDREEPPDYEHIPDGPDGSNLDPDLIAEAQPMHDFTGERPAPKSPPPQAETAALAPLPWLDMSNWDHEPIPERQWAIRDRVPLKQAGLFSGEGEPERALSKS